MSSNDRKFEIVIQTNGFFYELVTEAIRLKNLKLSSEAEFYVVDMLSRFTKSENLYSVNFDGSYKDEPLAFMMKEAEEESQNEPKKLMFRQIGDTALYTLGLFPDKRVSDDYYGFMGKTAYVNAATLSSRNVGDLYRELSHNFESIAYSLRDIPNFRNK